MGSLWYEKNPPKLCGLMCDIFKLGRSHQSELHDGPKW